MQIFFLKKKHNELVLAECIDLSFAVVRVLHNDTKRTLEKVSVRLKKLTITQYGRLHF